MTTLTRLVTADELLENREDGFRYELLRGELRRMAPAGFEHGRIAIRFGWRLAQHVETHDLGCVFAAETGFRLSSNPDTVLAPDVAFVRRERVEKPEAIKGYFPGAPDLAVEVVSPRDTYEDVEEKALEWLQSGATTVVVLNPRNRTAALYRSLTERALLGDDCTLNLDPLVPGFSVPVKDIFNR